MLILYFSGTGNTKMVCEEFANHFHDSVILSIENDEWKSEILKHKNIVFGYPVHFSNCPIFVRESIQTNHELFRDKNVYIIATMGLFSGDGAGCSARIFKKNHIKVIGGLHIKMPDNIADSKLLKKPLDVQVKVVEKAKHKIHAAAESYKKENYTKDGLTVFHHIAGLFGQRLWFHHETKTYKNDVVISNECTKCNICIKKCPTSNLVLKDEQITSSHRCTRCYRCVNLCPQKAITILGDTVIRQYQLQKVVKRTVGDAK